MFKQNLSVEMKNISKFKEKHGNSVTNSEGIFAVESFYLEFYKGYENNTIIST